MSTNPRPGTHAQNTLRLAIIQNGRDYERAIARHHGLLADLAASEQQIAKHTAAHQELSRALAILERTMPAPKDPACPEDAAALDTAPETPSITPTPHTVAIAHPQNTEARKEDQR